MSELKLRTKSSWVVKSSVARKTRVPSTAIVNTTFCVKKKRRMPVIRIRAPIRSATAPTMKVPPGPAMVVPKLTMPELPVMMPMVVIAGARPSCVR